MELLLPIKFFKSVISFIYFYYKFSMFYSLIYTSLLSSSIYIKNYLFNVNSSFLNYTSSGIPGFSKSWITLKYIVYLSDYSIISVTSLLRSYNKLLAGWLIISLKDSRPTPPLPISLLNSLIPITILESSQS